MTDQTNAAPVFRKLPPSDGHVGSLYEGERNRSVSRTTKRPEERSIYESDLLGPA